VKTEASFGDIQRPSPWTFCGIQLLWKMEMARSGNSGETGFKDLILAELHRRLKN